MNPSWVLYPSPLTFLFLWLGGYWRRHMIFTYGYFGTMYKMLVLSCVRGVLSPADTSPFILHLPLFLHNFSFSWLGPSERMFVTNVRVGDVVPLNRGSWRQKNRILSLLLTRVEGLNDTPSSIVCVLHESYHTDRVSPTIHIFPQVSRI